ncbi:MAG: chromosome partitioning protein ParB [Bacteroidetes bacterium]|nr:MAG: chromosome partitioning protein ParB [Bacteroidota bacterium]
MSSKKLPSRTGLGRGLGDMSDFQDNSLSLTSKINEIIRDIDDDNIKNDKVSNNSPRFIGQMAGEIAMIPIGNIERNIGQPREEFDSKSLKSLENSIRELGVIQPITVRKISALKYQIISGERRFRASQAAGLDEIPSYIREANDIQLLEMALVENVQRQDLHPIEIATTYKRLIEECDLTHEQVSLLVGKARVSITNSLRLLDLPDEIKIELSKRTLSQGHAKALLSISNDPERQILVMNLAITQKFSVRQTENLCKKNVGNKIPSKTKSSSITRNLSPDEEQAISLLRLRFGTALKLKTSKGDSGKLEFHYKDTDELQVLLDKLNQ